MNIRCRTWYRLEWVRFDGLLFKHGTYLRDVKCSLVCVVLTWEWDVKWTKGDDYMKNGCWCSCCSFCCCWMVGCYMQLLQTTNEEMRMKLMLLLLLLLLLSLYLALVMSLLTMMGTHSNINNNHTLTTYIGTKKKKQLRGKSEIKLRNYWKVFIYRHTQLHLDDDDVITKGNAIKHKKHTHIHTFTT